MKARDEQPRKPTPPLAQASAAASRRFISNSARQSAALGKGKFSGARHDSSYVPSQSPAQASNERSQRYIQRSNDTSNRFVSSSARQSAAFGKGKFAGTKHDAPFVRSKTAAEVSNERSRRFAQHSNDTSNRFVRGSNRDGAAFGKGRFAGNRGDSSFLRSKTAAEASDERSRRFAQHSNDTSNRFVRGSNRDGAAFGRGHFRGNRGDSAFVRDRRLGERSAKPLQAAKQDAAKADKARRETAPPVVQARQAQAPNEQREDGAALQTLTPKLTAVDRAYGGARPDLVRLKERLDSGEAVQQVKRSDKFSQANKLTAERDRSRQFDTDTRKGSAAFNRANNQAAKALAAPRKPGPDLVRLQTRIDSGEAVQLVKRSDKFSVKNQQTAQRNKDQSFLTSLRKRDAADRRDNYRAGKLAALPKRPRPDLARAQALADKGETLAVFRPGQKNGRVAPDAQRVALAELKHEPIRRVNLAASSGKAALIFAMRNLSHTLQRASNYNRSPEAFRHAQHYQAV